MRRAVETMRQHHPPCLIVDIRKEGLGFNFRERIRWSGCTCGSTPATRGCGRRTELVRRRNTAAEVRCGNRCRRRLLIEHAQGNGKIRRLKMQVRRSIRAQDREIQRCGPGLAVLIGKVCPRFSSVSLEPTKDGACTYCQPHPGPQGQC